MSSYYGSARLTSASEEEDYYFLQPMFEKLPPNEIISHRYAPDVATQVKLMYFTHNAVPRTSARTTCTSCLQKQKTPNWRTMPSSSMHSTIWRTHTLRSSTKQST
jgi:hypothetical protein